MYNINLGTFTKMECSGSTRYYIPTIFLDNSFSPTYGHFRPYGTRLTLPGTYTRRSIGSKEVNSFQSL